QPMTQPAAEPSTRRQPAVLDVRGAPDSREARGGLAILTAGLAIGLVVRAALLPQPGLAGDLDEFTSWVHRIATDGLGRLYAPGDVTFPPVMAYVWATLAAIEPAFRTATEAADPAIRVLMKTPPLLADLGLALAAGA